VKNLCIATKLHTVTSEKNVICWLTVWSLMMNIGYTIYCCRKLWYGLLGY